MTENEIKYSQEAIDHIDLSYNERVYKRWFTPVSETMSQCNYCKSVVVGVPPEYSNSTSHYEWHTKIEDKIRTANALALSR